ncbi:MULTISPECIES: hypothetical protein [unclassified Bradyrhizobium]|uniref:hypothetical protein n=1 Tax=unclassified Bradyrhizobium TaxID=2631580 RepID=UPI001BAA6716|nr:MULTISPECIES: hypothetical protein [unclassified Bradyrhizobium]MBR1203266.1 hypothetical protein [Bradyrhizobium sp. AUGA SZCCT0124]MBR1312929.1 hypothetical protein [Bradyrhizobium sp. AUGA SZCCT0051]MBR1341287.1 hypothetical protein [Bradyrhizobium sp. AUGA SZCCT0105]MBR1356775.1 hypothetical protein [Bradyrhizobium sp. AUGA SZCCT0045]
MNSADFGKLSLADRARLGMAYFFGESIFWIGLFLIAWAASYNIYLGGGLCLSWVLIFVLIVRRALQRDIEALNDPNDNPRANRLIRGERWSYDHRSNGKALRFTVEFFTSVAIIIGVTLALGLSAEFTAFALSDRDVNGAFGSGVAGFVGGMLGLVIGIVIALRRIADGGSD